MSNLSSDWHERTPLGEKLSRLDTDVDQIAQFGADAVNSIIRVAILFYRQFSNHVNTQHLNDIVRDSTAACVLPGALEIQSADPDKC